MTVTKIAEGLRVLDPTSEPEAVKAAMTSRLDTLDGKVVGLLDNAKPNSDKVLDMVAEILAKKYKLAGIIRRRKPAPSRGVPPETLEELVKESDFVITGVGD